MAKHEGDNFWRQAYTDIRLTYSYYYDRRCRGTASQSATSVSVTTARKLVRRHYSSTRGLKHYWVNSTFRYYSQADNAYRTVRLRTIQD